MRLSTTFRNDDEARAWVAFYCAVRPIDGACWEKEADSALNEYRKRHPGNGPEVSSITINLPVGVSSGPYRKAAKSIYPNATTEVWRGKSRIRPEVAVTMLEPCPYDRRIDPGPWVAAEGAIVALADELAHQAKAVP